MTPKPPSKHEMAPISRDNRPPIVGPPEPTAPYPLNLQGTVTSGFGRGARFLGIPTGQFSST
jgi:riboflavin kinase